MSAGLSFKRPVELHKIVAGCSAFAIQALSQIRHGTGLTFARTSCHRDRRTISFLSVEIMDMASLNTETEHLSSIINNQVFTYSV